MIASRKPSPYSRSSRASDISRLLDPSYTSSSSCSSSPRDTSPIAAYVDHAGDLHDPDYRDFPAFPRAASPAAKRAAARHPAAHRAHRRASGSPSRVAGLARPAWERGLAADDEDDEALSDTEGADPFKRAARFRAPAPAMAPAPWAIAPVYTVSAPPREHALSFPFRRSFDADAEIDDSETFEGTAVEKEKRTAAPAPEHDEQTPTCMDALRVQLKTLAFNLQFGLFRARRRFRARRKIQAQG